MAKRRKKHHTTGRRRRMGSVHGGALKTTGMEVLGLVSASVIGPIITRMVPSTVNPKIVSLAQMVGGFYLHRSSHPLQRGLGYGLLASGATSLAHDVGIIKGIEDMVSGMEDMSGAEEFVLPMRNIQGIANESFVSGMANEARVAGSADDYMQPITI